MYTLLGVPKVRHLARQSDPRQPSHHRLAASTELVL